MLDKLMRMSLYKQENPNELSPKQIYLLEQEIKKPASNTITDEYYDFKLWCKGLPSRQERFAEFIAKKIPHTRILEVGGGRTARLSRFLAEKGFKMTCIDPKLEVVSSDIELIKNRFDYRRIKLDRWEFVIAQEPCDATEHIVRACVNQNKLFMMSLCGVPHRLISGKTQKNVHEWYDYLVSIDSDRIKLRFVQLDPFAVTPILKNF